MTNAQTTHDHRGPLLACTVQRLLEALRDGLLSFDAAEADKPRMSALLDELEQRYCNYVSPAPAAADLARHLDAADKLARRLLDPEDLGFVANAEIRDAARIAVGIQPIESTRAILETSK